MRCVLNQCTPFFPPQLASLTNESVLLYAQRLCKMLLEKQAGMDVTVADDGDVALRMLIDSYGPDGTPFDLCLMDMQVRSMRRMPLAS